MSKKLLIGIDYSISAPAMSVCIGDMEGGKCYFKPENIDFFCYVDEKKFKKENKYVKINRGNWNNFTERWIDISKEFTKKIFSYIYKNDIKLRDVYIAIEGYSYQAKGLIFNIAECTGVLKLFLYKKKLKFKIYQPKTVKKFVTGNGNANKKLVYDKMCNVVNINLSEFLDLPEKDNSILYDFSDSLSVLYMLYCEMIIHYNLKGFEIQGIVKSNMYDIYDYMTKKNKNGYSIIDEKFILDSEVK